MLSLYQGCTGGEDWARIYNVADKAGHLYGIVYIGFTFFFHFAVFNVLTGLFVEKATCAALPDRDDLVLHQRRKARADIHEFKRVCRMLDPDASGTISWHDFEEQMHNEVMIAYMA